MYKIWRFYVPALNQILGVLCFSWGMEPKFTFGTDITCPKTLPNCSSYQITVFRNFGPTPKISHPSDSYNATKNKLGSNVVSLNNMHFGYSDNVTIVKIAKTFDKFPAT